MLTREHFTERADGLQRAAVSGGIIGVFGLALLVVAIFAAPIWAVLVMASESVVLAAVLTALTLRVRSLRRQATAAPAREELQQKNEKPVYRWFFEGSPTLAEVDKRVRQMMQDYIASTPPWNPEAGERWAREAWKAARPTEADLKLLLTNDPSIVEVRFADLTTDDANRFEVGVDGTARIIGSTWSTRLVHTVAGIAGVAPFKSRPKTPELTDELRAVLNGERTPVRWVDVVAEAQSDVSAHAHIVRSRSTIEGTFATPINEVMRELFLFVVEQRVRFMLDREGLTTLAAAGEARKAQLEQDRENERRAQVEQVRSQAAAAVSALAAGER